MNGNNRVILQPRDVQLFRELSVMRIADREQVMIAAGFGSITRANRRLLALTRAGFLRRFFLGFSGAKIALYALSPKGANAAGVPRRGPRRPRETMLVADYFTEHQLTINELYCMLKFRPIPIHHVTFHQWQSFHEPVVTGINLIPDGYVEFKTPAGIAACFLEVDLGHESRTVWKEKTRRYIQLALSGEYQKKFGQERFRVLVVTHSERKLHSIRKAVAEITHKIFWFATLASVKDRFFDPVWSRPAEEIQKSLFDEPP
ncbi:MAG: replication-relaxation family protein [Acidobacteriaceae bacterium]